MDTLEEKKEKKKAIRARNRRDFIISTNLRQLEYERRRVHEIEESLKPAAAPASEQEVWSAKVGEIKNRLTGKKRAATERWNRFAGTGDSGGRGL
jgi:hypothetical protein